MARFEQVSINQAFIKKICDEKGNDLTGSVDHSKQVVIFEDFIMSADATLEANGWNLLSTGDANDGTVSGGQNGTFTITTSGTDNQGSLIVGSFPVKAEYGGLTFETRLKNSTDVANVCICAGLTDSTALEEPVLYSGTTYTTTLTDGAVFCYDVDGTTDQWGAVAVDSDVDDTDSGLTGSVPVADTYQTLKITISEDGTICKFYINGTLVKTLKHGGVTETVALYPVVSVYNRSGAANTVVVDYIKVSYDRE